MFSKDWDKIYKKNKQVNNWTWSELVSYYNRYFKKKNKKNFNVLEIGSGTGPNAAFFFKNNINYRAIEGSYNAVKLQQKKYPKFKKNFICGDFTKSLKFKRGAFKKTEYQADRILSLPINQFLSPQDIKFIANKVNYFLKSY